MRAAFPRRAGRVLAGLLWLGCGAVLAGADEAGAPNMGEQPALRLPSERAVVRGLTIRRSNVFGADEVHSGRFYGRLANRLHAVTRESVVRRGLRIAPGDSICRDDLEAALRRLRGYRFLRGRVDADIERAPGDSIDLTIHTRDAWSTRPTFQFRKDGSVLTWSIGLSESNLFGLGKGAGVEVGQGETRGFYGWWLRDPQFTRGELLVQLGMYEGENLWLRSLFVHRPFEQPRTPWGLRIEALAYRGVVVDHRGGVDGPEWDSDQWLVTGGGGARVWSRGALALRAGPAVHLVSERYRPPSERTVPPALRGEPLRDRDIRMAGVELDLARSRYSERTGINAFGQSEDFDLGSAVRLRGGYSPRAWGAAQDGWWTGGTGSQGLSLGPRRFLLASAQGEGWWGEPHAREVRLQAALNGYANLDRRQTLAAAVRGGHATGLAPQAAYTLGALTGLRGFESHRYWGERYVLVNLEERIVVVEDLFGLVTAGLTVFNDWGWIWREGAREEARPRAGVGVGLRLLGSRTAGMLVTRIDIGFPVVGAPEDGGTVISIGAGQVF